MSKRGLQSAGNPAKIFQQEEDRRGERDGKGRREFFSFLLQKTALANIRSKILQGLMEGRESLISWRGRRGPELIIMKTMLRNTYSGFLDGMAAGLRSCSAFHLHHVDFSLPPPPSYLDSKRLS